MFRENTDHLQTEFFNTVEGLPEKEKKRLADSWAQTFYTELFCRIDETPFAELYSGIYSRPNTPVNILAGIEILKAGYGWSDEELYEAFLFNLQVRYALGLRTLGEGNFELRTLYNFRARVSVHMRESGENLYDQLFS
ncbi:MAG TPA: DDE transposase, partial [bacterium]|nr:DDE transposase [bacterium]